MNLLKFYEKWRQRPLSQVFETDAEFPKNHAYRFSAQKDVLKRLYPDYPLLPIEFLKECPAELEREFPAPPVHHFLSSGTTQRDRSRSSFSQEGLELYREFSLKSFRAMIAPFFPNEDAPRGISLIPPTSEWTNSSLAQMIAWIGEEFPLEYWNADDRGAARPALDERPVWLFATGFHIVAFADAGGRLALPKGSIVIETGGTKGKTRSVTREESFELITECFGVDRNHIVSEYGMCELASQAYDFVDNPSGRLIPMDERRFRFPSWVRTKVVLPDQSIAETGDGSLVVHDTIRSDIFTPFRTEDRAEVFPDGSFQLKGRVAFSPLKGCSMLAEDLLGAQAPKVAAPQTAAALQAQDVSRERAALVHQKTQAMLADPEFHALLRRNLGLETLARWALADLKASVPETVDAWIAAARDSQNICGSWLIIPPHTHDIALLHPLFLAAVLDLKVSVRAAEDDQGMLRYLKKLFHGAWDFNVVPRSFRIAPGEDIGHEGLLVFGSDETIAELRAATKAKVQGFGTWITASLMHSSSWAQDEWVKDAFSLGQQGCMSSRLLIVWDESAPQLAARTVTLGALDRGSQLHLAHSELDLAVRAYEVFPRPTPDHLVLGERLYTENQSLAAELSSRPLTLPVLRASRAALETVWRSLEDNPSFKLLSCDEKTHSLAPKALSTRLCALGATNVAKWTGRHGGIPLFFPQV